MLASSKRIYCTILPFALPCVVVALVSMTFLCSVQPSVAQDDIKFREFDRSMVHSPREMARDLNYLFLKDKKHPLADIDPEKLKKLTELGKSFIENLSEEEKEQARKFAETFMHDKGLNSPEGKQLMDQLGVSPEMQTELSKEFGDNDPTDFERFRDLFRSKNQPSGGRKQKNSSNKDSVPKRGEGKKTSSNGIESGPAQGASKPVPRGQKNAGQSTPKKVGSGDIPKDLFETLPNELGGDAKGNSASDLAKKRGDGIAPFSDGKSKRGSGPIDANSNKSVDGDAKKVDPLGRPFELPGEKDKLGSKDSNRSDGYLERGTGKSIPGEIQDGLKNGPAGAGEELAKNDEKLGRQELLEILNGLGGDPKNAKDGDPFSGLGKNKSASGDKTLDKITGKSPGRFAGKDGKKDLEGISGQEFDETFKSWVQMEAIRKGIQEYQKGGGPSEFQRRSLESVFKKGFKGLGDTLGDSLKRGKRGGFSESDFKSKLDRAVFEAAKESVQTDGRSDREAEGIGGAVEDTLGGLLEKVSEVAKKKREERHRRQMEEWTRSRGSAAENGQGFGDLPFPDSGNRPKSGGPTAFDYGSGALGAATDMLESVPELPVLSSQNLLMFLLIAGFVILALNLLYRYFSSVPPSPAARKFGHSFQAAKIRSPKDLVEAVDYFIVQKFGAQSQWWNARHAREVLCARAPGYSAKISDLIKDYVRARYTRADATLSAQQQLSFKKTLQELSRELPVDSKLPSEPPESAEASQDED